MNRDHETNQCMYRQSTKLPHLLCPLSTSEVNAVGLIFGTGLVLECSPYLDDKPQF